MVSMRFEGGKELAAALRGLKVRTSRSMQREALRDAAEPMRLQMQRLAPREPGAPDIADNMVISNAVKRDGLSGTEVGVRVGPARGFWYGYYQEWGTVHHGSQPFMRPAFDATVRQIPAKLARLLWTALAGKGIQKPMQRGEGPVSGGPGGSAL